jgi:hypothetical protein
MARPTSLTPFLSILPLNSQGATNGTSIPHSVVVRELERVPAQRCQRVGLEAGGEHHVDGEGAGVLDLVLGLCMGDVGPVERVADGSAADGAGLDGVGHVGDGLESDFGGCVVGDPGREAFWEGAGVVDG